MDPDGTRYVRGRAVRVRRNLEHEFDEGFWGFGEGVVIWGGWGCGY